MNDESSDPNSGQRSWLDRLGFNLSSEPRTREELITLLRDSQQRDILDADALAMIEGVLQVAETRVRDVMVPRPQMNVVRLTWPMEKLLQRVLESGHSRFPVIDDDRDDIIGILIVKDLLRYFAEGGSTLQLRDILRPAKFIPESKRLNTLLKEFRSTRIHMAVVVDEYGGVAGLVTIEDVLEQIVGEIDDEHDEAEDDDFIWQTGTNCYTVNALTPVEDFNEFFAADLDDERADTVGGIVIAELGMLPKLNDEVAVGRFNFKVLRADKRRVHLLELHLPDAPQHAPPAL